MRHPKALVIVAAESAKQCQHKHALDTNREYPSEPGLALFRLRAVNDAPTPLTIALIRQRYTPFGGAERFLERTAEKLSEHGAHITLVTRRWNAADGYEVLQCNPRYLGRTWRDWSFARAACRALSHTRHQLIQSHERIACCDVYRAGDGVHREWLRQRARVLGPWRRWMLSLSPYHGYTERAERRMFNSAQLRAVICNSHMIKDEIREHFSLDERKLHVIHSGIDPATFHPGLAAEHRTGARQQWQLPEHATVFVFVGSGYERKGLSAALQALARLPASAYLLVVGKDRHVARFQRLATTLGIEERTRFVGAQQDVRPYYGAADALLLPTLYDPFPNVVLEAMASGLPAVISTKCGAVDIVTHAHDGYVCDALDIAALSDSLRALMDNDRCRRMGAAAHASASPLTLEVMSNHYRRFYEALLTHTELTP